jgi:hypothetical protein
LKGDYHVRPFRRERITVTQDLDRTY